jgi:hypothetical protein
MAYPEDDEFYRDLVQVLLRAKSSQRPIFLQEQTFPGGAPGQLNLTGRILGVHVFESGSGGKPPPPFTADQIRVLETNGELKLTVEQEAFYRSNE